MTTFHIVFIIVYTVISLILLTIACVQVIKDVRFKDTLRKLAEDRMKERILKKP